MKISLSDDKTEAAIGLPSANLKLSAKGLSDLIRHLAWLRAGMLPAHAPVNLVPETQISNVPAIRWQATEDPIPGQSRLFLLHPGFGWLYIPLDQAAFDKLSERVRLFLQAQPSIQ
jgi:hypothetical protein